MTIPDPTQIGCGGWKPQKADSQRVAERPSDAAACSGVLPITELRLGMMARIIHPEYAAEYQNPVQIVMLERTQDGRENIAVAEAGVPGCVDGWKAEHLEIIPNAPLSRPESLKGANDD